jgi:CheY-like chemotaxis protein
MSGPRPRVILVEDDSDDVFMTQRAFARLKLDCDLEVHNDGQSAIERLEQLAQSRDIPNSIRLLLDLKLPKISGIEVLGWVRGHPRLKELPVIILTSSSHELDRSTVRVLKVDLYIVKPVSLERFEAAIETIASAWKLRAAP